MCRKIFFKFMVFAFLKNAFNLGIFAYTLLLLLMNFLENLFPPTAERGGEKYDLLYQNSVRKYEDDL